jgi:hypothetical protein
MRAAGQVVAGPLLAGLALFCHGASAPGGLQPRKRTPARAFA